MATEGTPARKSRRIFDDDDGSDENLPDIVYSEKEPAAQIAQDQDSVSDEDSELFADNDENDGKERSRSTSRKRYAHTVE
jgi:hypothetical protein